MKVRPRASRHRPGAFSARDVIEYALSPTTATETYDLETDLFPQPPSPSIRFTPTSAASASLSTALSPSTPASVATVP